MAAPGHAGNHGRPPWKHSTLIICIAPIKCIWTEIATNPSNQRWRYPRAAPAGLFADQCERWWRLTVMLYVITVGPPKIALQSTTIVLARMWTW